MHHAIITSTNQLCLADAANLIRSALRSSSVRKGQKISICHNNLGFLHDLQGTVGIKGYLTIQFYKSNHVCEDIQEHFSCVENVFNHDYLLLCLYANLGLAVCHKSPHLQI